MAQRKSGQATQEEATELRTPIAVEAIPPKGDPNQGVLPRIDQAPPTNEFGIPPSPTRAQLEEEMRQHRERRLAAEMPQRIALSPDHEPTDGKSGRKAFFTRRADRPIIDWITIDDWSFEIVSARRVEFDEALALAKDLKEYEQIVTRIEAAGEDIEKITQSDALIVRQKLQSFLNIVYRAVDPKTPPGLIEAMDPADRMELLNHFFAVQQRQNSGAFASSYQGTNGSLDSNGSTVETREPGAS